MVSYPRAFRPVDSSALAVSSTCVSFAPIEKKFQTEYVSGGVSPRPLSKPQLLGRMRRSARNNG
eukprot:scaffold806_cov115-Isochrysis_galbana.AAC.3